MPNSLFVDVIHEGPRGCGYRIPGADGVGIYLMGDDLSSPCDRLPYPVGACPCCGAGIKFQRGFQWIMPDKILDVESPPLPSCPRACPICQPGLVGERAGLMWVGGKHYPTPGHFVREAQRMGISKKLSSIPNNFSIGEHYVYLAHNKALIDWTDSENPNRPAIFMAYRPSHIDLVIDDPANIPDKALALIEKHQEKGPIRLVKVVKEGEARQRNFLNGSH